MAKVRDWSFKGSEFKLPLRYDINFRKIFKRKVFIPPAIGQIVPLLFFGKDGFGIK